eukprot:355619-Chlamydomonas_euryale.AAC.5
MCLRCQGTAMSPLPSGRMDMPNCFSTTLWAAGYSRPTVYRPADLSPSWLRYIQQYCESLLCSLSPAVVAFDCLCFGLSSTLLSLITRLVHICPKPSGFHTSDAYAVGVCYANGCGVGKDPADVYSSRMIEECQKYKYAKAVDGQ